MKDQKLPATAKAYGELAFREKENWRRRRAKINLLRKLEVLDRLRERARELAKIRLT